VDAVLVLNADLGPLHRVSLRHAIRMLCRQVAVVHEAEPDIQLGVFPDPRRPAAQTFPRRLAAGHGALNAASVVRIHARERVPGPRLS
jgi:hypothetical protein